MKKEFIFVVAGIALNCSLSWGQETTWRKDVKPLFDARCAACHSDVSAPEHDAFKEKKQRWLANGQGMRMNSYSHLIYYTAWPGTGALMRRLDDGRNLKGGKAGNMYQFLGATEAERQKNLAVFKAWVGTWVVKRWPDVTKDELNGIRVKY